MGEDPVLAQRGKNDKPQSPAVKVRSKGKVKTKKSTGGPRPVAVSFVEDGNVVDMTAEGMDTEYLSELTESDGEELQDCGENNNATMSSQQGQDQRNAKKNKADKN